MRSDVDQPCFVNESGPIQERCNSPCLAICITQPSLQASLCLLRDRGATPPVQTVLRSTQWLDSPTLFLFFFFFLGWNTLDWLARLRHAHRRNTPTNYLRCRIITDLGPREVESCDDKVWGSAQGIRLWGAVNGWIAVDENDRRILLNTNLREWKLTRSWWGFPEIKRSSSVDQRCPSDMPRAKPEIRLCGAVPTFSVSALPGIWCVQPRLQPHYNERPVAF